ncbi:hypothetical protein [Corallococcus llansteffanensis]|uniref:Uncharacterized protein n=1 Tax=Corallococcus llansteffanensis TaxID=2316731 RepID=A0A3A8QSK4_9BACT|nr:hypothetical protein [Corallococcus llansteffanensis]RKH67882.1 hypothetical protein D7V93_02085 [Corallococcus llansteffanensis]
MFKLLKLIHQGNWPLVLGLLALGIFISWLVSSSEERAKHEDSTPTPRGPTESANDTLLGAFQQDPAELPPPTQGLAALGKWKAALVLLAAGPMLALGVAMVIHRDDGGQLHVVAVSSNPEQDVWLWVDQARAVPTLHVSQHLAFPVSSGRHVVALRDAAMNESQRFIIDIRAGDNLLLSVHPDLCAVQIDMSTLTYGRPTRSTPTLMGGVDVRTLPVEARFIDPTVPVDIPRDTWLSFQEMPDALEPGRTAGLLTPLPCSLAQDDRSTWAAVRKLHPGINDAALRVGYTEEDPTRREVTAMDNGQLLELFQRQRP